MIHRAEKKDKYTVVDNGYIWDKRLSLKARGLMTVMLSLSDNWNFSIKGLAQATGEGVLAVRTALKELKEYGYVEIIKKGITWHFEIYEVCRDIGYRDIENRDIDYRDIENRDIENRDIENRDIDYRDIDYRDIENRDIENHTQLNTNISNTKELNTKESNTKQPRERKRSLVDMVAEYTENEELKTSLKDFIDMRKSIKKPLTERALKMIFNKLDNMAKEKDSLKVLILNQSVLHCWQDVYEYKGEDKKEEQKKEEPKKELDESEREFLAIFGL